MASLLLLLSELVSHRNADPDFWIALSSSSSSCGPAFCPSSTATKSMEMEIRDKYWSDLSEEMKIVQQSLHESRVSVDLVWP
ncbi:hypothetical protein L484_016856 [Morus notabilis]|uniref:Uncharacterized protein n=1 Tax=Morus notabilis TaxID=981085 RepID=W9QEG4_9ROSA|nr:hypothetical protein L484_016856 [Morus notabilis]